MICWVFQKKKWSNEKQRFSGCIRNWGSIWIQFKIKLRNNHDVIVEARSSLVCRTVTCSTHRRFLHKKHELSLYLQREREREKPYQYGREWLIWRIWMEVPEQYFLPGNRLVHYLRLARTDVVTESVTDWLTVEWKREWENRLFVTGNLKND